MFKSLRPDPISPIKNLKDKARLSGTINSKTCKSPSAHMNADLFINKTNTNNIKNMKIFNEDNDEGAPEHWDDKLKPIRQNPSIYDSLHSATIRPEMHPNNGKVDFFNRRNKPRLFSANRNRASEELINPEQPSNTTILSILPLYPNELNLWFLKILFRLTI